MRIMFTDEARFGRMNRPRPCWAPIGTRPAVASQLIREYIYLYGAVSPKDGICVYLIMPTSNTACFQAFLNVLSRKFARQDILLVLDGAPNHRCGDLALPGNISLLFLPPYSPRSGKTAMSERICVGIGHSMGRLQTREIRRFGRSSTLMKPRSNLPITGGSGLGGRG